MIEVKDLRYTYHSNDTQTLHGLNFEIKEAEIFGFLGPSGSGKSTTQNILIGLLKNYQGSIKIMGKGLSDWGRDLYEQTGVSFEVPNHYEDLIAYENLEYFQTLYRDSHDIDTLLSWVGLEEDKDKRVSKFSKGMKVRLTVARSLLNKPKILFLDEPTAGLDPINAQKIKELILKLRNEGTTVFITTHNMTLADQLCDRVAFITQGELRVIDSPKNLKRQYGSSDVVVAYKDNEENEAEK